jgi:hypothetical protein
VKGQKQGERTQLCWETRGIIHKSSANLGVRVEIKDFGIGASQVTTPVLLFISCVGLGRSLSVSGFLFPHL